jgi:hypothetical protein
MKIQMITAMLVTMMSLSVQAVDVYSDEYSTIESVEMVEVIEDVHGDEILKEVDMRDFQIPTENYVEQKSGGSVGEYIAIGREIIAFGKEVYAIIEAGKPVVNVGEAVPLSILPRDKNGEMVDAFQLENWKMPAAKKYRVTAKNLYGMQTIKFEFLMIFTYGGQYRGKGAYITGAEVSPTEVEVAWGYNLDASFKVQSISNQGTSTSPVAAAVIQINYTIKTILKESRSAMKFMINGNGQSQAY